MRRIGWTCSSPAVSHGSCDDSRIAARQTLVAIVAVVDLEGTGTGIDAYIVYLAALQSLQFEFRRTTIVLFLDDLERHGAGDERQIQADCKQQRRDPARRRKRKMLCFPLNHIVFLDFCGS